MRRSMLPFALALAVALALLAGGSSAAPSPSSDKLVEVVVTLPAAFARGGDCARPDARSLSGGTETRARGARARCGLLPPHAGGGPARARGTARRDDSDGEHPLALRRRARRRLGRPPRLRSRAAACATRGDRLADGDLSRAARRSRLGLRGICGPGTVADRRARDLGPTLATAGRGVKIGLVDDGIDQAHPYFDPSGFSYPAGLPKGNTAYTTPKVIVARAFPRRPTHWKYAARPFDPDFSDHATHVAGITAGLRHADRGRRRIRPSRGSRRRRISATTRRSPCRRRASASTATRRRSPRRSTRRSRTG